MPKIKKSAVDKAVAPTGVANLSDSAFFYTSTEIVVSVEFRKTEPMVNS